MPSSSSSDSESSESPKAKEFEDYEYSEEEPTPLTPEEVEQISFVNKLTKEEIKSIVNHYHKKYTFEENDRKCSIMGKKKICPRKRKGTQPRWEPLVRKDGYLQVTIAGMSQLYDEEIKTKGLKGFTKGHPRAQVLCTLSKSNNLQLRKVFWHQICWRFYNKFAKIPPNRHIAHRCSVRDCGTKGHIICTTRVLNEEHKKCHYVYFKNDDGETVFGLVCNHEPKCIPRLVASEACPIEEEGVLDMLKQNTQQ